MIERRGNVKKAQKIYLRGCMQDPTSKEIRRALHESETVEA